MFPAVSLRPIAEARDSMLIEVRGALDDALLLWAGIGGALRLEPRHVIVDLTRVTHIDESAFARLIASHDGLLIVPPPGERALLERLGAGPMLVSDLRDAHDRLARFARVEADRERVRARAHVRPGLLDRLRATLFPQAAPVEVRERLLFEGDDARRGCVIEVAGPFDERVAPLIEGAIGRATESGASAVAIDLSRALALSDGAIGSLLCWADRLEERGIPLVLVNVAQGARTPFDRLAPSLVVCEDLRGLWAAARRGPAA